MSEDSRKRKLKFIEKYINSDERFYIGFKGAGLNYLRSQVRQKKLLCAKCNNEISNGQEVYTTSGNRINRLSHKKCIRYY